MSNKKKTKNKKMTNESLKKAIIEKVDNDLGGINKKALSDILIVTGLNDK